MILSCTLHSPVKSFNALKGAVLATFQNRGSQPTDTESTVFLATANTCTNAHTHLIRPRHKHLCAALLSLFHVVTSCISQLLKREQGGFCLPRHIVGAVLKELKFVDLSPYL